jgi:hypothetical protein
MSAFAHKKRTEVKRKRLVDILDNLTEDEVKLMSEMLI